jgi:hypothetical protein
MVAVMSVFDFTSVVIETKLKILHNSGWGAFITNAIDYYLLPKFYMYRQTGKYFNMGFYFSNYNFMIQWNWAFQVESVESSS